MKTLSLAPALLAFALGACMTAPAPSAFPSVGTIHMEAPALAGLMDMKAPVEKLAEGFTWSEGPVWISDGNYLLFSDVPANVIFRWSEKDGLSEFLKPSGYAGDEKGIFREPGSNGLIRGPTKRVEPSCAREIVALENALKRSVSFLIKKSSRP